MTRHCSTAAGRLALASITLAALGPYAAAQEGKGAAPAAASASASSWLPILEKQAADYRITPRGSDRPFRTIAEPILRWTQPVRGGDDGAVFLWVDAGRPGAVATIFTWRAAGPRVMQHEIHSLAPTPLDATWRGKPAWNPEQAGVSYQLVPGGPEPAPSAAARGRQMQAIARDFSGSNLHTTAGRNELRLMPRPLYRYEPTDPDLVDGALFCLAHGTDPEAFVLVEAHRDGGKLAYRYALARFSDLELHVSFKGREVWTVPPGQMNVRDRPHAYFNVEEIDAETPEDYRRLGKDR